jgi:peptidoglycan hydrolase-like protein with peptidoglycan-binding domain
MKAAHAIGVIGGVSALAVLAYAVKAHADDDVPVLPPDVDPKPGPVKVDISIKDAQGLLNKLGAKLVADGLYGPNTQKAWDAAAKKRKVGTGFVRKSGTVATVLKATADRIAADAKKAPKPVVDKPDKPVVDKPRPTAAKVDISVKDAQTLLNKLGAKLVADGLYGPNTQKAWDAAAKNRKVGIGFVRKSGTVATVLKATADRIAADAKKADLAQVQVLTEKQQAEKLAREAKAKEDAAKKKAAEPAKPVAKIPTADITVKTAQTMLNALGAKLVADGLYGPNTQKAWDAAAKNRGQAIGFVRKNGTTATVAKAAADRIGADAKAAQAKAKPVTPTPKPVTPKPVTPTAAKADISVKTAQTMLNALGAKLVADGLYGPNTQKAWDAAAKNRGQTIGFVRKSGTTATVTKQTADRIGADAKAAQAKAKPAALDVGPVVITAELAVTEAQTMLNNLGAGLTADGLYGPNTQRAWDAAAKNRSKRIGFTRKTANSAIVAKDALDKIRADSIVAEAKRETLRAQTTPPPAAVAGHETVIAKVLEVQRSLNEQGIAVKQDGLYGPATLAGWQKLTTQLKLAPRFERVDANRVRIDSEAAKTVDGLPPKGAPAKAPAPPAGYDKTKAKAQAKDVAAMLVKSGKAYDKPRLVNWQRFAGLKPDGVYGPLTKSALEYYGGKPPAPFVAGPATKYQPPA